ncbi:MAG: ArnT family glycosyltransferase [Pseudomarimonas sp.]
MNTPTARAFGGLFVGLLIAKLYLATQLPLFGDEAFYWLESRHLALAHDDVPGLTAWLIRAGTLLGGHREWAVRLPFVMLALLTVVLLMRIAASMGRPADAWMSGLLALCLPLFAFNGLLALPDVPLTLAVLLCVDGLARLMRASEQPTSRSVGAGWLALGIVLGWLSHYRFAVPFAAAGLCLLIHPGGRQLLRRPPLWIAGSIGSAIGLAPLLWHQFAEAGNGFAFQFVDRHPWRFQPEAVFDLLLQALLATPVLFAVLVFCLWLGIRRSRRADVSLVAGIGFCILACYLLLGPFVDTERSRLHWPMPALLIAATLVPTALADAKTRLHKLLPAAIGLAAMALGGLFVILLTLAQAPQRLASGPAYLHGFTGWRQAGEYVQRALEALPADTVVIADHFTLAAELGFGLQDQRRVFSLDHPLNVKHGRQGELMRMQLAEQQALIAAHTHPVLVVLEESATRLRQRPAWFRRLCTRFPAAQPLFDVSVDHGRKRLIGYFQAIDSARSCVPPAVGYLAKPAAGAANVGHIDVEGWAIRDRVGLAAVRMRLDGLTLGELDYRLHSPAIQQMFPGSDDPRHPLVGFRGRIVPALPAGVYWLEIEAEGLDGVRSVIANVQVEWRPLPAGD